MWLSTFQDARPVSFDQDQLVLAVPSALVKDKIERSFLPVITDALQAAADPHAHLCVVVHTRSGADAHVGDPRDDRLGPETGRLQADATANANRPEPVAIHYTFDAFVTGASNQFAQAAALRVAEMPGHSYNPLFLYGDAGLGKTHLLQAIRHYVGENYAHYRVRYVTSEQFLNEFVDSIRLGTNDQFKRRYRQVDVLLVDDIQFIEGRKETQEEFFHTFNAVHEQGKQIVLSSDRSPDAISTLEARLRSRFKMGLTVDIQPPDLDTRLAILRKKAEPEPAHVPDDVLELIATNISDNIRELEGALTRVAAFANLTQQHLTVELAEEVLSDLIGDRQPRPISVGLILEITSDMFGFDHDQLTGTSRQRPLVQARQIAMYATRETTDLSFPAIAREFGGRDHTTVIHAFNKISKLMKERRQIYEQVTELIQRVKKS